MNVEFEQSQEFVIGFDTDKEMAVTEQEHIATVSFENEQYMDVEFTQEDEFVCEFNAGIAQGKIFFLANGNQATGTATGGGGMNIQMNLSRVSVKHNGYTASTMTLTVEVTGTYTVSWTAWRSSSSGTMGTNLHVNSTTGTNQQTFTNTYGQQIELTNQHYSAGDVLTIYATSGSSSRTINIANLIIEQTA